MRSLLLRNLAILTAVAALLSSALAQPAAPAPVAAPPAVVQPVPDASVGAPKAGNDRFLKMHESFLARAKSGPIGLLFLGDSITEGWKKAPHIWDYYYGQYQPANFGIGGDQTQHVIWRIEQGELDGITPKVLVLMLGTNNTTWHTAEQIAAADKKIVEMIRAKLPQTKILLLAIFPRGLDKNKEGWINPSPFRMDKINAVNPELAKLDDGKMVRFLNINANFLGQDGKIPYGIMPDQLHPNAAGYQIWADAMAPLLKEMLQ
jgi:lysophospholipase L1-like esterase